MKKVISKCLLLAFATLLIGCAASYKPIDPPSVIYRSSTENDGLKVQYKYNMLEERGNKRYTKKEGKYNIRLVSLKITNNTGKNINLSRDVEFYANDYLVLPLDPSSIQQRIKQTTPTYLLYLLLSFLQLNVSNGTDVDSYPIGLIIGPPIAIGNFAVASNANTKFLREMQNYNLHKKEILDGQTVYGIIGITNSDFGQISLKLISEEQSKE